MTAKAGAIKEIQHIPRTPVVENSRWEDATFLANPSYIVSPRENNWQRAAGAYGNSSVVKSTAAGDLGSVPKIHMVAHNPGEPKFQGI